MSGTGRAPRAAVVVALATALAAGASPLAAQDVPVTLEVRRDADSSTPMPTPPAPSQPDGPPRPVGPGQPGADHGPVPDAPTSPLPRTGADAARALRVAAALVTAGLALLVAARTPERRRTR